MAALQGFKALPKTHKQLAGQMEQHASAVVAVEPLSPQAVVEELQERLTVVRQNCNDEARERRLVEQRRRLALDSVSTCSDWGVMQCLQDCPAAADSARPVLSVCPSMDLHLPGDKMAQAALEHCEGKRTGLRQRLQEDWLHRSRMISEDECAAVAEPPGCKPTLCALMGACFCAGQGLEAFHFHRRFVSLTKPLFTPRRKRKDERLTEEQRQTRDGVLARRRLLLEGFVVVRFSLLQAAELAALAEGSSGWRSAAARMSRGMACTAEPTISEVWLMVGYVNLSTWAIAGLRMKKAGVERGKQGETFVRLEVPRPADFTSGLFLFRKLDLSLQWSAKWYRVLSDDTALSNDAMVPDWVLVSEYATLPEFRVWMGCENERQARDQARKGQKRKASAKRQPRTKRAKGRAKARVAAAPVADETAEEPGAEEEDDPESSAGSADEALQDWGYGVDSGDEDRSSDQRSQGHETVSAHGIDGEASEASALVDEDDENVEEEAEEAEAAEAALRVEEPAVAPQPAAPSEAAGRSLDPAPVPAPVPVDAAPSNRKGVGKGVSRVRVYTDESVPFGSFRSIRYNIPTKNFLAVCGNPAHGSDCKRSRTSKAEARMLGNLGQGRPCGLLAAWLKLAYQHESADSHKEAISFISLEDRRKARSEFQQEARAHEMLGREREKQADEPEEPTYIK